MRIVCDIDGTLCEAGGPDGYAEAAPKPEAIAALNALHEAGHTVILYTGRHIERMKVTYAWMARHGVKFDHICFGKPVGDLYIDDLTVNCQEHDWNDIRRRIDKLPDWGP